MNEARQTSKGQTKMTTWHCQDLCRKVHDRAKSLVMRSYTMRDYVTKAVGIG